MAGFSWRYDPKTEEFKKAFILGSNVVVAAANAAVEDSAKAGVAGGRASIAGAGFSKRWQNSLRYKMVTKSGSLNPVAYIHTTINYADVFETGKDIQADTWLWLPFPTVPGIRGRRHMTPAQYIKNIGPLIRLRRRAGLAPILAAVIRRGAKAQPFGKFATRGQLKRGKSTKSGQVEAIPLFIGVKSVRIGKKWDVNAQLVKAKDEMPKFYEEELRKLDTNKILQGQ